jgi:hypothetical protein
MATDAPSGSFDLPWVAKTLLRTALRTAGFYFLGNPRDHWAERKVEGEAVHAAEPAASGAGNSVVSNQA